DIRAACDVPSAHGLAQVRDRATWGLRAAAGLRRAEVETPSHSSRSADSDSAPSGDRRADRHAADDYRLAPPDPPVHADSLLPAHKRSTARPRMAPLAAS